MTLDRKEGETIEQFSDRVDALIRECDRTFRLPAKRNRQHSSPNVGADVFRPIAQFRASYESGRNGTIMSTAKPSTFDFGETGRQVLAALSLPNAVLEARSRNGGENKDVADCAWNINNLMKTSSSEELVNHAAFGNEVFSQAARLEIRNRGEATVRNALAPASPRATSHQPTPSTSPVSEMTHEQFVSVCESEEPDLKGHRFREYLEERAMQQATLEWNASLQLQARYPSVAQFVGGRRRELDGSHRAYDSSASHVQTFCMPESK